MIKGGSTPSIRSFYESGLGDRLTDPSNYPDKIVNFLQIEQQVVTMARPFFDLLIEVGCADGRYLDWAVRYEKRYIGIDIVERYIHMGRETVARRGLSVNNYRFIVGDGESLATVIQPAELPIANERCLILFPFNSFGNMQHPQAVLASLQQIKLSFLISSYQVTRSATSSRREYYKRCGYQDLHISHKRQGVCFSSPEGLYTIAYYPHYLRKLCAEQGLKVTTLLPQRTMNAFYTNHPGLEEILAFHKV